MRACAPLGLAVALLGGGCGARTGLDVPDGGGRDAGSLEPDAGAPPPPPVLCVDAPQDAGPIAVEIVVPAVLRAVDVFFLLDSTGSMIDEIDNVREGLRERVVPGLRRSFEDLALGVGIVGEFPFSPHGEPGVLPYALRAPITDDVIAIESALEGLPRWGNADEPEAQVEALYQVATGAGYGDLVPPALGCPSGGDGGACFRTGALPVVLLVTDAPFHQGPPGVPPETRYRFRPTPRAYDEAVDALRALGALVVGLSATDPGVDSPRAHLDAIARDTGAVDARGAPLTRDIGPTGDRVGEGVVALLTRVAGEVPLDVSAMFEDVRGDAFDVRDVVRAVRVVAADPPDGVRRLRGAEALGASAGTRLVYVLEVDTSALPPSAATRRITGRLVFRALGRSVLATVRIDVVVPGADGGGCREP